MGQKKKKLQRGKTTKKPTGESSLTESVVKISTKGKLREILLDSSAPKDLFPPETGREEMPSSRLMISISGIRGVIGNAFNPEIAARYGAAFGTWTSGGPVVVGRDSRVSGAMIKSAVISSLEATGCRVIDVGIVPTPTVEIAVKNLKAHGGIAITASHNPVEWNALKLIGSQGQFLDENALNEVLEIADNRRFVYSTWDHLGKTEFYDYAINNHVELILELEYLNLDRIRERRFRVALDCVNGAGAVIAPQLLGQLGCEIIVINEETHGIFPRNPEPTTENLAYLEQIVKETNCDIGFALDPDADRLAIVSEKGEAVGEEYTLACAVEAVLSHHSSPVVVNASTSMIVDDIARRHQVDVVRTRIGEIHVSKKMLEMGSFIGGEGNGGVIVPQVHPGRDACTGMALILQLMTERNLKISEIIESFPLSCMKKTKIELQKIDVDKVLDKIVRSQKTGRIDRTDGIKILLDDSWIHFRKSNTEPVIRILAESRSEEETNQLITQFTSFFV